MSDNKVKTNKYKLYQVQMIENSNKFKLVHVGNVSKTSDILIKKFDITDNIFCNLISCLLDENEIENRKKQGLYSLIRIDYYDENKLLGNIVCEVKIDKIEIDKVIVGKLFINHYYNSKVKCLEEIKVNPTNKGLIEKCVANLVTYFSQENLL